MKNRASRFSKRYLSALRHYIGFGSKPAPYSAPALGREALLLGWQTLELARLHEQSLAILSDKNRATKTLRAIEKHASIFFLEAVEPIEQTHRAAREAHVKSTQLGDALREGAAVLNTTKKLLNLERGRCQALEEELVQEAEHYNLLLEQSRGMHAQMRGLVRQVLCAQEEERKEISRELHDAIAQPLAGIHVQLAVFKQSATLDSRELNNKISAAQRLVEKSVNVVHQFARNLRPAVLDDLGLIPALRSYMKALPGRKGLKIQFTAVLAVEAMDSSKRTVLYRVAQEALTNVTRHSRAKLVTVQITKAPGGIRMEVRDDGKSFRPDRVFAAKTNQRLGLLGMRERVEMVGGRFAIESAPGKGTRVCAEIPFNEKGHS